jgi:hypothetical protein
VSSSSTSSSSSSLDGVDLILDSADVSLSVAALAEMRVAVNKGWL